MTGPQPGEGDVGLPAFDAGANRLGALAVALTDRLQASMKAGGRSASAAAALSALYSFLDEPSVDQLGRVVGLTSSGAVRLVDGLEAEGLVTRRRGTDARVTVVTLTQAGRQAAEAMMASRSSVLREALAPLSASERASFDESLSRVLVGLVQARAGAVPEGPGARDPGAREPGAREPGGGGGWLCRLCDTAACGAERGKPCPVTCEALGLRVDDVPASHDAPQLADDEKGERPADEDEPGPRRV